MNEGLGKEQSNQDTAIVNKNLEVVKKLNIMDDMLFFEICEDKKACKEILSIILCRRAIVTQSKRACYIS